MNIASIDIGTNTVLLLIAKIDNNNLVPLLNVYRMPRLGKDLNSTGKIADEKIELLISILNEYKTICSEYDCSIILPFATQAMRSATNNREVIRRVFSETGLRIEIISGHTEAKLSFIGSISNAPKNDNYLVIDIGGGSTEIIYGNDKDILFAQSFKIGVVTLTDKFINNLDNYNNNSITMMKKFISESFIFPFNLCDNTNIISVAGTPTSLSCMIQKIKDYNDEYVENKFLTSTSIKDLILELETLTPKEILQKFGDVLLGREDLILTGAIILEQILDKLQQYRTLVSTRGLRYGIIYDYLANNERKITK